MHNKKIILEELRQHKGISLYCTNVIEELLDENIILEYTPVGEMGVYKKGYIFTLHQIGKIEKLENTCAELNLIITSHKQIYDIEAAIRGEDCFHNVIIKIRNKAEEIAQIKFRLWNDAPDIVSGRSDIVSKLL